MSPSPSLAHTALRKPLARSLASLLIFALCATPPSLLAQEATAPGRTKPAGEGLDATTLPEVVVTANAPGDPLPAYAGGQVAEGGRVGLLGDRSVFDTPFSTTAFTAEFIKNTQPRSVGDLLLNDPSVTLDWPRGSFVDRYLIRGFSVSANEASLNGLFGITQGLLTLAEGFERVELFKGPTSLLNGKVGSVGGSINYVTKRATTQPFASLTTTYDSVSVFGGHLDVGRRFGKEGELGVRFNGAYRKGELAVEHEKEELGLAALGVDYRFGGLRVSADFIYQKQYQNAPRSQIYYDDGYRPETPGRYYQPLDASKTYQDAWEFAGGSDLIGMFRADYDVNESIQLFGAVGGRSSTEKQSRDIPVIVDGVYDAARGDFGSFPDYYRGWSDVDSEMIGGRAKFGLWLTKHELSLVANRLHRREGGTYTLLFDDTAFPNGLYDNIYRPVFREKPKFPYLDRHGPRSSANTESSVALADIISILDERVQAIVGVRHQRVVSRGYDEAGVKQTQNYDEDKWTPAYTLLVKPWKPLSIYGSYIQALEQGPVAPEDTANAGQIFPPSETEQYELGAKYDFGHFGMTLAWFQITQPSGQTVPNGVGLPIFKVDGEQRNRGVEFGVFGEPRKGVRLLGGLTWLDAVRQKTEGGIFDGQTVAGTSEYTVNVGAEYDLPWIAGLTLDGRVNYQTKQFVTDSNNVTIPAWTRFDLGFRYARKIGGRATTYRFGCENVANKNYWSSASNGYLLARPRTFSMSVTVDF